MKKGLLILVPALLLSLTACDLSSLAEKLGGNGDDGETSQNAGDNSNGNGAGSSQQSGGGDNDDIFAGRCILGVLDLAVLFLGVVLGG